MLERIEQLLNLNPAAGEDRGYIMAADSDKRKVVRDHQVEILLVEDNPSDVELTVHVLKKHNLANRIKVVRDGEEALDFLFGNCPDGSPAKPNAPKVVLLDLKLPKVGGLEVLARIKSDPRTRTIPVVVLTSSQEDSDLMPAYELGVNSYIVKPVDFGQFTDTVRQLGLYWLLMNQQPVRHKRPETIS